MKYKTLFRLLLRLMGLWLVVQGAAGAISIAVQILQIYTAPANPRFTLFGAFVATAWRVTGANLRSVIELIAGLYLFFGGKWIVNLVIPSNRPYCPECGYDLSKASASECPECGTPIEKR